MFDMITPITSHSAFVTLELIWGDRRIPLAQAAHDFAILVDSTELPPGEAEIEMTVDGSIVRMPVFLPNGCDLGRKRFSISKP